MYGFMETKKRIFSPSATVPLVSQADQTIYWTNHSRDIVRKIVRIMLIGQSDAGRHYFLDQSLTLLHCQEWLIKLQVIGQNNGYIN